MPSSCPSCHAQVPTNALSCDTCNYGYDLLNNFYNPQNTKQAKAVSILNDTSYTLKKTEVKAITRDLKSFQATFPDLFFAVHLESKKEKPTTKGLWLLNNVKFTDLQNKVTSQYGILLYIDPEANTAALSYGLGLSPYITLEESNNILRTSISLFSRANYPRAIRLIIRHTSDLLISKCHER